MSQVKKYVSIGLVILALSSCGAPAPTTTAPVAKTPYQIQTLQVGSTQTAVNIEKVGRITANSTLTLSAQGMGEVSKVYVKEGQAVKAGALIASLKDTQNNYDLRYSQAQAALRAQDAAAQTTKVNLEQAVETARISLARAQQAYNTLTGKNALSYDTLVSTNNKTLDSYNQLYKTYLTDADRIMTQLMYEGDKILGITDTFRNSVNSWKPYLGVLAGNTRLDAENGWNNLYAARGEIRARLEKAETSKIDPANVQASLDVVTKAYGQSRTFVDAMIYMLQNNSIGGGLTPEINTAWNSSWNGLRSSVQASETQYNTWKAQTTSFFTGYKDTEQATALAVASLTRSLTPEEKALIASSSDLRISYENTRLDLADKITTAKLSLEQAEQGLKSAIALQSATIAQLAAGRESNRITLLQAERDYSKLRVTAPVDGIITKVITSVGQTVSVGAPIAEFTGKQPQIIMDIEPDLAIRYAIGEHVLVKVGGKELDGIITARSTVANANLLSTIRIAVPDGQPYLGESATVVFGGPSATQTESGTTMITLPIDAIKIIAEGEGEIFVLSGETLAKESIKLGQVIGDTVEILSTIATGTEVITTDMSNFDADKNFLQKQP